MRIGNIVFEGYERAGGAENECDNSNAYKG